MTTTTTVRCVLSLVLLTLVPALSAAGERRYRAHSKDGEILQSRGQVQLRLTGFCGPEGRGRRAVLQSVSHDETMRVSVETSLWSDDRFRSSSSRSYSLSPLGEKDLGCTLLSVNSERRFALSKVSDASSHHPALAYGPARDAVDIVDSGSCGRGRQGRTKTLVNRHPWRPVSVRVATEVRVEDRLRRKTSRAHRLSPGSQLDLGCSADGALEHRFDVVSAEYRTK